MAFLANLLGYVLNYLYNWVQNYGWAIIIFSVLLKLILLPFTIKQQKNIKKSAKISEETSKLQVKYKNDPEKLNREIMDLYKREKASPFSGCLSSVLQLIIFISVFYLVSSPLTYMKKIDKTIIDNYKTELTESGQTSSYPEIKIIENKSQEDEKVNINMNFLGLDLSKVPMQNLNDVRVYIIPILYIVVIFINTKITTNLTSKNNKKNKNENNKELKTAGEETTEEQMESIQQMTNSMSYMMPIMSVAIALIAPLGLSLYWLVSNLLQLAERITIDFVSNKINKTEEEK
ncbi:membrane protein insertase YidC/Oxa1 family [Clostridium sp. CAG:793]|mgnify:FL=1|nr:membrane protein insertase YidC/Oxa1 family [Clostridium sp. CAG:793]